MRMGSIFVAAYGVTIAALGGGTATFNLSSPSNGATVSPGELIQWTITVSVSTADNLGLALAAVDLVQDAANPALFDLPAGGAPLNMADFDRPDGISNPGPGGVGSAYGGTPVGATGAKNLRQIGGAQNTFGVPGNGIGLDYDVRAGVGQGSAQILATGSFFAPSEPGDYALLLENAIANTLDAISTPPDFSPVSAALALIGNGEIAFTVAPDVCVGDMNCSGEVNFKDINPFVVYLSNLSAWQTTYVDCPPANGDINGDGTYPSFKDINPFVVLLSTTTMPIPCP
jgi:hypothetical protein